MVVDVGFGKNMEKKITKLDRIDLFLPPGSPFGALSHLTERFSESLMEEGILCRILEAEKFNPRPFLEKIFSDRPDCTLSFNGLLPDSEGRFFSDLIQIPHVAFVLEPPTRFAALVENPKTLIACSDEKSVEFFHALSQGVKRPLFLMPGVEKEMLEEEKPQEKGYEIVFFGTILDPDRLKKDAAGTLSPLCYKAFLTAAEMLFQNRELWYIDAFVDAVNQHGAEEPDLNHDDFLLALYFLEEYVTAEARVTLLEKFADFPCDAFVSPMKAVPKRLSSLRKLQLHEAVPFEQMLEIQQRSKAILQASPLLRHGASERLFYSLATGAVVIAEPTPFLKASFEDKKDLFLLSDKENSFAEVKEGVAEILQDDRKRQEMSAAADEKLLQHHTWNARAKDLIQYLKRVLPYQ